MQEEEYRRSSVLASVEARMAQLAGLKTVNAEALQIQYYRSDHRSSASGDCAVTVSTRRLRQYRAVRRVLRDGLRSGFPTRSARGFHAMCSSAARQL
jgi:hypothetical protein